MFEILFQYGPVTITSLNVFLALAFVIGTIFLVRFIHLKKMRLGFFVNNFIYLILFPLIGGRLLHVIEHFEVYKIQPLQTLFVWDMGFSPFGIFYAGIITLYILSRRNHEDLWSWLDGFIISGLSGLFFVHIGHFFNGTHYGTLTEVPWGIAFDTMSIPFIEPIHPTQLYSALLTILALAIAMKSVKRTHLTGVAGTLGIMLYSMGAFGIDFLHGNPSAYDKVNYLIIAALAFIFYIHCTHKKQFSKS